jgi:hypothetical protein
MSAPNNFSDTKNHKASASELPILATLRLMPPCFWTARCRPGEGLILA